jgi:DNA-binding response OmpR family regulator
VSEAATNPGIDVAQIAINAPKNPPSFDDTYQMASGSGGSSLFSSTSTLAVNTHRLLVDINLNGLSGIELKRKLTDTGVSPPVIFITGRDEDVTRRAALSAGWVAYL